MRRSRGGACFSRVVKCPEVSGGVWRCQPSCETRVETLDECKCYTLQSGTTRPPRPSSTLLLWLCVGDTVRRCDCQCGLNPAFLLRQLGKAPAPPRPEAVEKGWMGCSDRGEWCHLLSWLSCFLRAEPCFRSAVTSLRLSCLSAPPPLWPHFQELFFSFNPFFWFYLIILISWFCREIVSEKDSETFFSSFEKCFL